MRYGARRELQFRTVSTKKEIVERSELSWLLNRLSLYRGKSQRKESCFNKTLLLSQNRTVAYCPGLRRGESSCLSRSSFLVSRLIGRKDSQFLDTYLRTASRWGFSFLLLRVSELYLDLMVQIFRSNDSDLLSSLDWFCNIIHPINSCNLICSIISAS